MNFEFIRPRIMLSPVVEKWVFYNIVINCFYLCWDLGLMDVFFMLFLLLYTFAWFMTRHWSMYQCQPVEKDFCFYNDWFYFCRSSKALVLHSSLNFQVKLSYRCSPRQIRMEANLSCSTEGNNKEARGALVVLEGLDRSGKSSQCSRLVSYLEGQGLSAELWRFPDRTTDVGQMISAYLTNASQLDDHTIHLLFSANRWEKRFLHFYYCFPISFVISCHVQHSGC